ncbi:U3 snoRNP-associated protein Utp13 [Schizosaccharomyces cryophilus OY26]|uniref:U3 snoRNP-associated protein Utp13 n=1 Tax=Schizosaccharomyces cryophilus (strain OY26 / ATCC MYA-4695 / CBS 11777 / NBRC 106824 / NRRL Y48691) TaxID=653667 RepID=S9X7N6_SCHCR|nr:U3 snoRNP-associated protein Utp13 [Schizosaccharomyces cryophilus OY26]EPY49801.1 U3 snoRNP-associated protein Utp13 [Schizosaccharomyces cryophilus OY26]
MAPIAERTRFGLKRSIEPIYSGGPIGFASNEKILVTSLGDRIMGSNGETGEKIFSINKDEDDYVTSMIMTSDGSKLVVAFRSRLVTIYEVPSGRRLKSFKAHETQVITMTIDPTNSVLATGGAEGLVKVWDLAGGYTTHVLRGHGGIISALRFGKYQEKWVLASGADDTRVRLWDLNTSRSIATFEGHSSVIRGLTFDESGSFLLSGSRDKTVQVWDLKKRSAIRTIPVMHGVESLGWVNHPGKNEKVLYTAGEGNIILAWNWKTGARFNPDVQIIPNENNAIIQVISMDDNSLLTVHSDLSLLVQSLSIEEGFLVQKKLHGSFDEVIDCAWIGDDHLAIASNTEYIDIISADGTQVYGVLAGHTDIVLAMHASEDGVWLATGAKDNTTRLWNLDVENNKFTCVRVFTGHTASVTAVALGPLDAHGFPSYLVSASQDRTLKRYDLGSSLTNSESQNRAIWTIKAHDRDINAVQVSADGRIVATVSQDKLIKLWDSSLGEVIGVLRGHRRGVWACVFNPHSRQLASGSGDRTVRVWSIDEQQCLHTLEGHTGAVLKLAYISRGTQLISAAADGLVKVWSIASGECVATLDNHEDRVWAVAVRDDGARIVSGGADAVVSVWQDVTEEHAAEEAEELERRVEAEQSLANYEKAEDWRNAIALALSLDRPLGLLRLFERVMNSPHQKGSITGNADVDKVVSDLSDNQLTILFQRIRDWNVNNKTSMVAQRLLHLLLHAYPPKHLLEIPGIKGIFDSMFPYTQRHLSRINDLLEESYIVDYVM